MTKSRIFLPELDGLRLVAFLLIFIHHSATQRIVVISQIRTIGWLGVEIFFCLSAFLLTRLLLREIAQFGNIDVYKFFIRRILRIWPLYFCYVIFAILLSNYLHVLNSTNWYRAVGLITFTDNFFSAFQGFNPVRFTSHLWTISYEEQFYLFLPFLIPWLARLTPEKRIVLMFVILMVSQFAKYFSIRYHLHDPFIWTMPVTHLESILAGIIIAFYEDKYTMLNQTMVAVISVVSVCLIFFLPETDIISYHLLWVYPLAGLFSGSVVCFLINGRTTLLKRFLSGRMISFGGKISFGLYVFHSFCMSAVDSAMGSSRPLLNLAISFSLVVVVSVISYFLFEKRFLAIKKDRFTRVPVPE